MAKIHTIEVQVLHPFPVYTCDICGAYAAFTKGCTNCDYEKLQFEKEAMQKLYLDMVEDQRMDYVNAADPEDY